MKGDQTIVYYKDGSVFIGQLVEENNQYLKIVLATKDTISIDKKYIQRIKYAPSQIIIHKAGKYHYTHGFFMSTQGGLGVSERGDGTSQLDLLLGWRFNERLSAGIGIGIHSHQLRLSNWTWITNNMNPVYAYGRYYLTNNRIRPFADMKLGYGFGRSTFFSNEADGIFMQTGVGFHFASRKLHRYTFGISHLLQNASGTTFNTDQLNNEIRYDYKLWYNRILFTLGIEFH